MNEHENEAVEPQEGPKPDTPPEPVAPPLIPLAPPEEPTLNPVSASIEIVSEGEAERQIRRMSRRSFLWAGVALVGSYAGLRWLDTRRPDGGLPWPFRRAEEVNEQIARDYFQPTRLAPTFPRALAAEPRQNGDIGMSEDFDPEQWQLRVEGVRDAEGPKMLTLADIRKLPKVEMVTELKCIEGWSAVVHWAGASFADFAAKYPPVGKVDADGNPVQDEKGHPVPVDYISMETPDAGYYVGLDMASALHPQTLLCYEMNGEPLPSEHGAPLRLVIPVKYGIKNIKRIGTIRYTDERPKDYWAEDGYDWYAGH